MGNYEVNFLEYEYALENAQHKKTPYSGMLYAVMDFLPSHIFAELLYIYPSKQPH